MCEAGHGERSPLPGRHNRPGTSEKVISHQDPYLLDELVVCLRSESTTY